MKEDAQKQAHEAAAEHEQAVQEPEDRVIRRIEEILSESRRNCFEGHVEILFNVGFPEFVQIVEEDGVTKRVVLAQPLYDPSAAW